jgi:hypothetical protein
MNMELGLYLLSLFQCSQVSITATGGFCEYPNYSENIDICDYCLFDRG